MGDEFTEYVTARGPALLRFAYVLCGDRHLAEDLVQSVLARVYHRWRRIVVDAPDAYVRRSIVHEYLSWRRRLSNRELTIERLPERAATGTESTLPVRDEMWHLLATLPRTQRVVLTLRFYEDMTFDEIAAVLGTATSTVRVHASRALATLRIRLETDTDAEQATRMMVQKGMA